MFIFSILKTAVKDRGHRHIYSKILTPRFHLPAPILWFLQEKKWLDKNLWLIFLGCLASNDLLTKFNYQFEDKTGSRMSELPVYFFDLADIRVQTLPKRDISQTFQENVMQKKYRCTWHFSLSNKIEYCKRICFRYCLQLHKILPKSLKWVDIPISIYIYIYLNIYFIFK